MLLVEEPERTHAHTQISVLEYLHMSRKVLCVQGKGNCCMQFSLKCNSISLSYASLICGTAPRLWHCMLLGSS